MFQIIVKVKVIACFMFQIIVFWSFETGIEFFQDK